MHSKLLQFALVQSQRGGDGGNGSPMPTLWIRFCLLLSNPFLTLPSPLFFFYCPSSTSFFLPPPSSLLSSQTASLPPSLPLSVQMYHVCPTIIIFQVSMSPHLNQLPWQLKSSCSSLVNMQEKRFCAHKQKECQSSTKCGIWLIMSVNIVLAASGVYWQNLKSPCKSDLGWVGMT